MYKSVYEIDLEPDPARKCWNCPRPWDEEIIYFLLADRFHDGKPRTVVKKDGKNKGYGNGEQLNRFYGGTLAGITGNLGYIKGLGVTAIGLSPVFENNPGVYHGYATQNYLNVDPNFGTIADLRQLAEEAHRLDLKIYLDVVINHTGDNWHYRKHLKPLYRKGRKYTFGGWNNDTHPLPAELRNEKFYRGEGMIRNWDDYPETEAGDFFILKKLKLDYSAEGNELMDILVRIFSYWIKETDCDGFRIDALKHLGKAPAARFCSGIRDYCNKIGKENFLIFGELIAGDAGANAFFEPHQCEQKGENLKGVDTIFDFPLHFILQGIVEGKELPVKLRERYVEFEVAARNRTEAGRSLITFPDNHDQVGQQIKKRFGTDLSEEQMKAGLGILFCLPGIPSLYYGTEQWFSGTGPGDQFVREAMFSGENENSFHNTDHSVYKTVKEFAEIRKIHPVLIKGDLHFNAISENGSAFGLNAQSKVVVFSRVRDAEQIVVLYNTSASESQFIMVKLLLPAADLICITGIRSGSQIKVSRGKERGIELNFFKIELQPSEFVILK